MISEEHVFDKLTNPHRGKDGRDGISFDTYKAPKTLTFGTAGNVANQLGTGHFKGKEQWPDEHECIPIKHKGDQVEEIPMFLSNNYREIYDNSKKVTEEWNKEDKSAKEKK